MEDNNLFFYMLGISIVILLTLYLSYKKDKTRLINGVILNIFFIFMYVTIVIGAMVYNNLILRVLMLILSAIIIAILIFGVLILIVGCLLNARIVLKRERKSLSNMLTLFIGIGLLILYIISFFNLEELSPNLKYVFNYITLITAYFILSFYNYFVTSILYGMYKPKYDKDYIIVLGSGLINGNEVSKLLGSRIDKALEFYNNQKNTGKESKVVFSGGQGNDETIPEALAMKNYAMSRGLQEEDAIIEDKSKNTLENFEFSKNIMDKLGLKEYEVIFTTSNYHVFRAEIYARKTGMKISGIGSKTAFYYLANAMIREYIAIVSMKKKSYIKKFLLITFLYIAYTIVTNLQ